MDLSNIVHSHPEIVSGEPVFVGYIFDNSTKDRIWLAAITDGSTFEMKTTEMTGWFKRYVVDRFVAEDS